MSDFDNIWRGSKGSLPHVRTDLKNYLNKTSHTRIRDLNLASYYKLSNNLYGRFTAGYLEPMYAGISSELYLLDIFPKLSVGAELNFVKPREFSQGLGFRKIDGLASVNGHISGYWDTGYRYYNAQVDAGKYLANDIGSTLTISRDFPNGWSVGGFFTLTDASFEEFGEEVLIKEFFKYH